MFPGQPLADARALAPGLRALEANPAADRRLLDDLADWCGRYSPWTASAEIAQGQAGIWLDVTGCEHLFGGPSHLIEDLLGRLRGFGFTVRAALAPTPGAAWAFARFDKAAADGMVVTPLELRARLRHLPVSALRLPPLVAEEVTRFGLGRIGDLYEFARGPLVARFGPVLARRLDQTLGRVAEPISPHRPVAPQRTRIAFAEPITTIEVAGPALQTLLDDLCRMLEARSLGARRLELAVYRVDGAVRHLPVGTHRAVRDPDHLYRLMAPHLDKLGLDAGVEIMMLSAAVTETLLPGQLDLEEDTAVLVSTAPLIDRLASRLGAANVLRPQPRASHLPERAQSWLPSLAEPPAASGAPVPKPRAPRPVKLLARPERVDDVIALVPDAPPRRFSWRGRTHRIRLADGPERIAPEWWRGEAPTRDYYRVEDAEGRRFWLYREGLQGDQLEASQMEGNGQGVNPRWYLHGFFA